MKPLATSDLVHLKAAHGWLELGSPVEAAGELGKIAPVFRAHPDVIELRCRIYAKAGKWKESALAALALVKMEPQRVSGWVLWAAAFQNLKGTQEIAGTFPPALDDFPAYYRRLRLDLAFYACELTKQAGEWDWLERAFGPGAGGPGRLEGPG